MQLTEENVGEIMAERELSGGDINVLVRVWKPFAPQSSSQEFWCPYQIDGIGSERIRKSIGLDSIQALLLALQTIAAELYSSEEYQAGKVRWFEDGDKDLGFPLPEFLKDLNKSRD